MFQSLNPYTSEISASHPLTSQQEVDTILTDSQKAFNLWKQETIEFRSKQIKKIGELLTGKLEAAAQLITKEMGKPISQSRSEIQKCIDLCDFYAEKGTAYLSNKKIITDFESYVTYEPLEVILGIMPWNYPFWQVFRFAIPTLLSGNTVLLKHATNVPTCSLFMEVLFAEAINTQSVFQNLFLSNEETQTLIANKTIKGVSFTGSAKAGRLVASEAGKWLKPCILELGGSNALIVCNDADLDEAVQSCIKGRFQNNGQSCIAVKRLLIAETIKVDFTEKLLIELKKLKTGNPEEADTFFSVLSNEEFVLGLKENLQKSLDKGAKLIYGGNIKGAFFEPTVVVDVTAEMSIFKKETFGPVLAITAFKTIDEAVRLANDTDYGLGVSVFSSNRSLVNQLIPQFEDGAVFVNSFVKSIAQLPFGGAKTSGLGRELAEEGIKAFTNTKTVVIK
mgnify:CR=1 FL=1